MKKKKKLQIKQNILYKNLYKSHINKINILFKY